MRTRLILLGSIVSCAAFAASPIPPGASSLGFGDFTTLGQFDSRMAFLSAAAWELPGMLDAPGPDPAGRTLQEDLDEFLLTEAARKELEGLRAAAAAAVDGPEDELPVDVLQPLALAIGAEYCRLMALSHYWDGLATLPALRSELDVQVARLPQELRSAVLASLDQADERTRAQRPSRSMLVDECDRRGAPSIEEHFQLLEQRMLKIDEYNAVRQELAESLTRLISAGSIAPESFERTTACPPAPANMTGGPRPSVRRRGALGDYYPPRARDLGISGSVRVRLEYDTTGCVTRAVVLETSASADLDGAAARFVLDTEVNPAVVDGKPAAGGLVQKVNFNLADSP